MDIQDIENDSSFGYPVYGTGVLTGQIVTFLPLLGDRAI
jgi:hypothetical protein